jgi:hypothetical protein
VPVKKKKPPVKVVPGGWSEWRVGPCSSGCIIKARGEYLPTSLSFATQQFNLNTVYLDVGCGQYICIYFIWIQRIHTGLVGLNCSAVVGV